MTQIIAYLTFDGNCREAMTFYQACLGGELTLQTIAETPLADQMPDSIKGYILHASLVKDGLAIMASDMVPESGLKVGNAVSLMLDCSSEAEIRHCYENLSAGGQVTHALEDTFYGALMGNLTDKFGHHWILNFEKTEKQYTNQQISEAFSSGQFPAIYAYFADDIQWNLINDRIIEGKAEVVAFCDKMLVEIGDSTLHNTRITAAKDRVVIEGYCEYSTAENIPKELRYCDVYHFKDGLLSTITSYCIEST